MDLKRLEDLSQDIVQGFDHMKMRAKEMRNTNGNIFVVQNRIFFETSFFFVSESTNKRVFYFSLFSMVCLITLATWQVFYLRRYFKAKKLIE